MVITEMYNACTTSSFTAMSVIFSLDLEFLTTIQTASKDMWPFPYLTFALLYILLNSPRPLVSINFNHH